MRTVWHERERLRLPLLAAVVLLSLVLRVVRLPDANIWWDEAWTVWLARKDLWAMTLRTAADVHPPLHYALLHFWIALAGESAFAVRYFSVMCGVVGVAALYQVGRLLVGRWGGLLAALFLAVSRFHIWWSQEVRMYTLAIALLLFAVYFALRLLRNDGATKRRNWVGFVVFATLCLLTLYLTVLALIVLAAFVFFAGLWRRESGGLGRWRFTGQWVGAHLAVSLLFAPWLWLWMTNRISWGGADPMELGLFIHAGLTTLTLGISTYLDRYTAIVTGLSGLFAFGLVFGALVRRPPEERGKWPFSPWTTALFLAIFTFVPAVASYGMSLTRGLPFNAMFHMRYLVVFQPIFMVGLAWGLVRLLRPRLWPLALAGALAVTAVLVWSTSAYYAERHGSDDFETLTRAIANHSRPGDGIIINSDSQYTIFLYHYPQGAGYYGVPTAMQMDPERVRQLLEPIEPTHDAFWMVLWAGGYESDPTGLVAKRLGERYQLAADMQFDDRRLYLYSRTPGRGLARPTTDHPLMEHALSAASTGAATLLGYDQWVEEARPGETVTVTLYWRAERAGDFETALNVVDGAGRVAAAGRFRLDGTQIPAHWEAGELRATRFDVVASPALGDASYRLEATLTEKGQTVEKSSFGRLQLRPQEGSVAASAVGRDPQHPLLVNFGDKLAFTGYSLRSATLSAEGKQTVTLYWRGAATMDESYTVFVHLLGPDGQVWGQVDRLPMDGAYPTSRWQPGENLTDVYEVTLKPDAPPGRYQVEVGLYSLANMERLRTIGPNGATDDKALFGEFEVK